MQVRYNPVVAVTFIVLGSVAEFLTLWVSMLGEVNPGVFVMWIAIVIGALYLTRPYFSIDSTSVVVHALVGSMKREFPYQSLEFEGNKLVTVREDGTRKRVPVARWLARSADWSAATERVR